MPLSSARWLFSSAEHEVLRVSYELNCDHPPFVMEGYLSKKSSHTSDSFLHSNYFGIMVNEYSINIAYMTICTFVTCR